MAVELAKVSLWLHCFTLSAPLSFLDHHLRCGNSLIGVTVDEVNRAIQTGQLSLLSGTRFGGMKQAVAGMIRVGELSDVTAAQLHESGREYRRVSGAMKPAKRLLDVYTSQWFGNTPRISGRGKKKLEHNRALEFLRDGISEQWAQNPEATVLPEEWKDVVSTALQAVSEKRFFHWELEFPEVFYGPREGLPHTVQIVRLENAGFDAVVGNPPYENAWSMTDLDDTGRTAILTCTKMPYVMSGHWDLYVPFVSRALEILQPCGLHSFIVPDALAREKYSALLRKQIVSNNSTIRWVHFEGENVFDEVSRHCIVYVVRKEPPSVQNVRAARARTIREPQDCGARRNRQE